MATKTKQSARAKKTDTTPPASEKAQKPLKGSFYEKSKHLIGSIDSGLGEVSSNEEYLEGSSLASKKTNGAEVHDVAKSDGVKGSFYEKNKHLAGCFSSGLGDLSSNKEYMKGFGRSRNAGDR
ncbi:MAG: hypothetical protein EAZ92_03245 [Candidatus Kapaibacterium sp.]|nr:MAG: hypothetical protein EAZ92_03245 [Candidatus Kapabacteria bacterium]